MFVPDADPATTTNPNDTDTDEGGTSEQFEDPDKNGRVDMGECDPNDTSDDANCDPGRTDCAVPPSPVSLLRAAITGAARDDMFMTWDADPATTRYNIWFVENKEDIDEATVTTQPPAQGVVDCSDPNPADSTMCTDVGAISRTPTVLFYQVKSYCGSMAEGP